MRGRRRSTSILAILILLAGCGESRDDAPRSTRESAAPPAADTPPPVSLKGYDVVVVVVDGLRADRAADPAIAPFISGLAYAGLSFTNARSNSSHVLQSLASMFTGQLPTHGGTIGVYEAEPHEESTTLPQHFQQAGYYTGLLANHPAIQGMGFTKGFQEVQVAQAGQALDDAALAQRAAEFLEDAGDDRVFLYVHFAGPLASKLYRAGEPGAGPFSVRELGKDYAYTADHPMDQARVQATIAEYDSAIRAADDSVKALVEALRAAGRAEKTLLVVTSLHGFELFEHGYLGAGWTLYDESVRVPLIFYAPGAIPALSTSVEESLVNVSPTVLSLLEMDPGPTALDGEPIIRPGVREAPARPSIAELVIAERCILRSVSQFGWTYVASSLWAEPKDRYAAAEAHRDTANAYLDGSRPRPPLWGAQAREVLLQRGIEVDLAANGRVRAQLAQALEEYRGRCESSGIAPRAPVVTVKAVDADQIENLESLGYL